MGTAAASPALPEPVVQDILRQYADVLRVGRLVVNGGVVKWNTAGASTANQLHYFCASLHAALRQLPEATGLGDVILARSAYWLCKALSINYALAEVLEAVSRKVGGLCCIEAHEDRFQDPVDYSVRLSKVSRLGGTVRGYGHTLGVSLDWKGKDNIVARDPATAERVVKGTLSRLETEFPLPPARGYAPRYTLQLQLKRSLASQVMSTMSCAETCSEAGGYCESARGASTGWSSSVERDETLCLEPVVPLRSVDDDVLAGNCTVCPGGLFLLPANGGRAT